MNYEKVFESIKSNLVPKAIYEESKNEISRLKIELQNARKDSNKTKLELEKARNIIQKIKLAYKSNYDKQKMAMDIIKAQNERLEAENEKLITEMKTFQGKLNDFQSILTQKTLEYAYLLKQSEWSHWSGNSSPQKTKRMSTRSQTIKETPKEIGTVNVPASLPSVPKLTVKLGTKRTHTVANDQGQSSRTPTLDDAKRRKYYREFNKVNQNILPFTGQRPDSEKPIFTCEACVANWAGVIQRDFGGDPYKKDAPNPRIRLFSIFEAYREHVLCAHRNPIFHLPMCEKKSCLRDKCHNLTATNNPPRYIDGPHGDIICKICDLSFELKEHHDRHLEIEHFCYDKNVMSRKQIFDIYMKYKNRK